MAVYLDEEEVWKCPNHPSKRRRIGICPTCLRERLVTLCPDCATARPCNCCPPAADSSASSSSSSSSSFSIFSSSRGGSTRDFFKSLAGLGDVGRVSNLIDGEPAFRRSRSLAIPFRRSRSRFVGAGDGQPAADQTPAPVSRKKINFWGVFKVSKNKKDCEHVFVDAVEDQSNKGGVDDYSRMMRSRSVAVGAGDLKAAAKGRGWYFPSPMKVFRQTKTAKVVHGRSPLYRG